MIKKTLDVIIPTYHPDEDFLLLIEGLSRQRLLPQRLIIINTEESLMPEEIKKELSRFSEADGSSLRGRIMIRHIKREEFDHAATRSLGAKSSASDAFLFMTDDAVPADEYLTEKLLEALYEKKGRSGETVAMAYARQLPRQGCSESEIFTRSFNYPEEGLVKTAADRERLGIKTYFASNVCCAYRRDIFEELGGFCSTAIFNEDMIYAEKVIRNGYAICYEPEARVIHSHDYGPMALFHRNFDLGMSQAMNPEVFSGLRSEGEGLRLVISCARHLISKGKILKVPGLFVDSAFKYAGYRLGKAYKSLPPAAIRLCSSNRTYIDRMYGGNKKT